MTSKQRRILDTGLFIFGCIGVVATAVMSGRDTLKAEKILEEESIYRQKDIICDTPDGKPVFVNKSFKEYTPEVIKATWKCYIPTAITMALTLSAFIVSKRLTTKEIAALSTALAGAGSLVTRYRGEIRDRFGEDSLRDIDKKVASDEIAKAKPPVITTSGLLSTESMDLTDDREFIFFDPFTHLKFRSTKLAVLGAKYFLNRNFALGGNVPLAMFYEFLGIALPEEYNYCSWDCEQMCEDGYYWIDIDIVRSDEPDPETGEQYYILEYGFEPGENEESYYMYGNPMWRDGSFAKEG